MIQHKTMINILVEICTNAEPMSTETSNTSSQQNERVNDTNGDDLIMLSVSSQQDKLGIVNIELEVGDIHEARVLVEVDQNGNNEANIRQMKKFHQCPYKSKHKHHLIRHMIVHLPARTPKQELSIFYEFSISMNETITSCCYLLIF